MTRSSADSFIARDCLRDRAIPTEDCWALEDSQISIGVVLFLSSDDTGKVALIEKAPKPDYEFGHKWALPGGLVRPHTGADLEQDIHQSIQERVSREAGIAHVRTLNYVPSGFWPAPVSSYTAKGGLRHTILLSATARVGTPVPLSASDRSVLSAEWADLGEYWAKLAPAKPAEKKNLAGED